MNVLFLAGIGLIVWGVYLMTKQSHVNDYNVPYGALFHESELQFGLPNYLLVEVARQESGFNKDAFNAKSGATGIMQIVPKWHPDVDATNPLEAIPYAAKYLKTLYAGQGSWERALVAYNWGIGNLIRQGFSQMPAETRNYLASIKSKLPYDLA